MKKDRDLKIKYCLAAGTLLVLFRLWLASRQMIYILPLSAPIDDDLYFNWANSIVAGNWLGEYNWLTLSKYPFFALWLAFLHIVKIPYLIGGCLLWILVAAAGVFALAPVIKKNIYRLVLFAVIIYNPSTYGAFTLRVYRDNIFPPLCTLFFLAMTGAVLRLKKDLKGAVICYLLAGVGMAAAFITREDGYWLLPFYIAAAVIGGIFVLLDKNLDKKAFRLISTALPAVLTVASVLTICSINYKYYNVFTLTDFNGGSFADCYGAMTRLSHENWHPLVAVPEDVRQRMYEGCPSFKQFEYYLEESAIKKGYASGRTGDYQSGSFYWALRRSADELGIYESPQKARRFWEQLAGEVNRLREKDENALPPRSTLTPPLKAEYVPMVLENAWQSVWYVLSWQDMSGYENQLSDVTTGQIEKWESFLYTKSNYAAVENSALPYHSPTQKIAYKILDIITWIYRALIPLMLIAGAVRAAKAIMGFGQLSYALKIILISLGGMVAMAIFRIFIISFMEVAAFNIGIYSMYLGTVYPLIVTTATAACMRNFEKE